MGSPEEIAKRSTFKKMEVYSPYFDSSLYYVKPNLYTKLRKTQQNATLCTFQSAARMKFSRCTLIGHL